MLINAFDELHTPKPSDARKRKGIETEREKEKANNTTTKNPIQYYDRN